MKLKRLGLASVIALAVAACSPSETAPEEGTTASDLAESTVSPQTQKSPTEALSSGETRSVALVHAALDRIEEIDRNGPTLQSVLSINPDALEIASRRDEERASGEARGPLHGLPILIKDNIDTIDPLPTTAGSTALLQNFAVEDAPLVAGLREAGAVILGKSNLSEWANFRSEDSISGWTAIGGLTRNPHVLDRSACGSSTGSGAAVAAGIVAGAVGTETNGSIMCPSSRNGVVGFKPTVGLVSQKGIIPVSPTQDTAGPITISVELAAQMLDAMDNVDVDYVSLFDEQVLDGLSIGVLRFADGDDDPALTAVFDEALGVLEEAGATLTDIEEFEYPDGFWDKSYRLLKIEFGPALDAYLAATPDSVETKSLADLIEWNEAHADEEMQLFDQSIFEAAAAEIPMEDPEYPYIASVLKKASQVNGIDALLKENKVDVLVSPTARPAFLIEPLKGSTFNGGVGAVSLAAIAGYPHLTVPMGTVNDLPVGLSFIGTANDDARILSVGRAYEIRSEKMATPKFLPSIMAQGELADALSSKADSYIQPPVAAEDVPLAAE